ncbi:MAG: hypothetical protein J0I95_00350 [Microbacterium sp.]|uniref:hypothetical protein n=1 Tax=unclassified Microbacterium TaxID=2609290 RepID=UPI001ACBB80F|nr:MULTISPECIES: hypothetical protein [unclassified Microbacterium]MBN9209952.1 hypothetical protein [Microbacterium sp.]
MSPVEERGAGSRPQQERPWGTILAVVAACVFAAPTLLLPADGPVTAKLGFIVVGAVLLAAAIILTRREPGASGIDDDADEGDVRP